MFTRWAQKLRQIAADGQVSALLSLKVGALRYHGLWTPGVRLMQRLRFRAKGLLIVASLALPLGLLLQQHGAAYQAQRTAFDRAQRGLEMLVLLHQAQTQAQQLQRQLRHNEGPNLDARAWAQLLSKEQAAFSAILAKAEQPDWLTLGLQGSVVLLSEQRDALRKMLANQVGPAQPTLVLQTSLTNYLQRLEVLRLNTLAAADLDSFGDANLDALLHAGLEKLPTMLHHLQTSHLAVTPVFQATDGRRSAVLNLLQSTERLEVLDAQLDQETKQFMTSDQVSEQQLHHFKTSLASAKAQLKLLVRAGFEAESPRDVQVAVGEDAVAVEQRVTAAMVQADAFLGALSTRAQANLSELERRRSHHFNALTALTLSCLLVATYLMICMQKVMGGGLNELSRRVAAVAEGDLSERPEPRGQDEVGQTLSALAISVKRMSTLFEAVTQGVAAVSHASREVANGNAGLTGRTAEIRQSIGNVGERANLFMEAMNACDAEAERIAEHMRDVRVDARRSRLAMSELHDCMKGLRQNSRDIARVINLVEVVAQQTRLLSLNASVEAARAGAAGKGFMVVATEVRALARRSEDAARKIHDIVNASINEIEHGAMLSDRVGESVRNTDDRIAEVSKIVTDIVSLTRTGRDQSQEVVGITRDVEGSADGNARMVEQLAHASADLRNHGDNLKRSIQHFIFS